MRKMTKFFLIILLVFIVLLIIFLKSSQNFHLFKSDAIKRKNSIIVLNRIVILGVGEQKYMVFNNSMEILNCSSQNKYFLIHSVSCNGNISIIASRIGKYNIKVFLRNLKSRLMIYNITVCIGKTQADGFSLCGVRK